MKPSRAKFASDLQECSNLPDRPASDQHKPEWTSVGMHENANPSSCCLCYEQEGMAHF